MKTSHACSLVVAFAVVLSVWMAGPASAKAPTVSAASDTRSVSIVTHDPIRPPSPGDGPIALSGNGDSDGDPDDIMGGNNVVKGPMVPTTERGQSVRVVASLTLVALMRAWMLLIHSR